MVNPFCECEQDSFCNRYQRIQSGRFREICQGVNVDLGTAAAFREQWASESQQVSWSGKPIPLLLKTNQAPGDAVVMTAAIYSLHKSHPNKYLTAVESEYADVFKYNPYITPLTSDSLDLQMHYPAIHQSNERGIHFMQGFCEHLSKSLNIHVPLLTNRPHLYFNTSTPSSDSYWLICSGGKQDFTTKLWGHSRYQEVVDRLKSHVDLIQVGSNYDEHPQLSGVYDLIGATTLRQLFNLVRRAKGVICGVSLLMHVAAALEKPAIVIAGGREPVQWNSYPKQHYLHTVGMLPCSDPKGRIGGACWRGRVNPLGDNESLDRHTCEHPKGDIAECMTKISPEIVADLVLCYNS